MGPQIALQNRPAGCTGGAEAQISERGPTDSPTEWAGLGWLGWAGWLAGLQEGANQRGKSFRTLRLRPAGWGPNGQ